MAETSIEWTDRVWNPVRGCSRVSPGCDNCYAMRTAHRFNTPSTRSPYHGLTTLRKGKVDWTGIARFVPEQLAAPLSWRKPSRIFVDSMSDLFHHDVTNEQIAAVFGVMAVCFEHTFQVLTKRPDRMVEWFQWIEARGGLGTYIRSHRVDGDRTLPGLFDAVKVTEDVHGKMRRSRNDPWARIFGDAAGGHTHVSPLPNVWLGVSVENQATADERIPLLLKVPAAVRFVSAEPLLGPIDFRRLNGERCEQRDGCGEVVAYDAFGASATCACCTEGSEPVAWHSLDWVIVGGESGPGARPCNVEWIRSIVRQCKDAGTACFVKQLGADVFAPWMLTWVGRHHETQSLVSERSGITLANVWPNGTWHTWDRNGIGGENGVSPSVAQARSDALDALSRQQARPIKGWALHRGMLKNRKGSEPSEWPNDLRVRQVPGARDA